MSAKETIHLPSVEVSVPPPVEERIDFVPPNMGAFGGERSSLPQGGEIIPINLDEPRFRRKRALAEAARQLIESEQELDGSPYGIRSESISAISVLSVEEGAAMAEQIINSPDFSLIDKIEAAERYRKGGESKQRIDRAHGFFSQLAGEALAETASPEDGSGYESPLVKLVTDISKEDVPDFVSSVLDDPERDTLTKISVMMRAPVPSDKDAALLHEQRRAELIRSTLGSPEVDDFSHFSKEGMAIKMISAMPEDLQDELRPIAREYLEEYIAGRPASEREDVWSERSRAAGLLNNLDEVLVPTPKKADKQMPVFAEKKTTSTFQKAANLTESIKARGGTKSPLHDLASSEVEQLQKTGTETYILPKDHEASVRLIPLSAAEAWLAASENWPAWHEAGFNYVPVEPIQSIDKTDVAGEIAVVTTNLPGKAWSKAINLFPRHREQLEYMKEAILDVLSDMSVYHGHAHHDNFVIVPYTKKFGLVDVERCPRLYIIDFDQAELKE